MQLSPTAQTNLGRTVEEQRNATHRATRNNATQRILTDSATQRIAPTVSRSAGVHERSQALRNRPRSRARLLRGARSGPLGGGDSGGGGGGGGGGVVGGGGGSGSRLGRCGRVGCVRDIARFVGGGGGRLPLGLDLGRVVYGGLDV